LHCAGKEERRRKMNSRERVLTALKLQKPDRVPFMELGIDYDIGARILGKNDYTQFELAEFLKLDGIGTTCYPILYAQYQKGEDGRNYIVGGTLKDESDLARIQLDDPRDDSKYDHVKRIVEENNGRLAVFGATNIGLDPLLLGMGLDNFSYALVDDPGLVEKILDIYTDWAADTVEKLQDCGVDIIWFTDDIAFNTTLMFSPQFFREIAMPRLRKVMERVKVPTIYHSDGNIAPVIDDLIDLGINGIHPIDPSALDIEDVKRRFGSRICLVGNIDLRYTLVSGTVDEVKAEVKDRIEKIGKDGGYILCSANTITNYCKPENVMAMRDALLEYGSI